MILFCTFVADMKHLDFDELWENHLFDYKDGDLLVIDDISRLDLPKYEQTSLSFVLAAYCVEGRMQATLDGREFRITEGELLIYTPGKLIGEIMLSQNAHVKLIAFAKRAIDRSLYLSKYVWKKFEYISKYPVFTLNERERAVISHYYGLLMLKTTGGGGDFHHDVVRLLFQALTFEFMMFIDQRIDLSSETEDDRAALDSNVRQSTLIYRNFTQLLHESDGRIRNVATFADLLHITPKYLSKCVKEESGQAPLALIHEATLKNIVRQLRYSEKSIKEICTDLDFPNISFFGKFVRQHLGMSPTDYRNQALKDG